MGKSLPFEWSTSKKGTCHLIDSFKVGGEELVTYKYWEVKSNRWEYQTEEKYLIELEMAISNIVKNIRGYKV